MLTIPTVSNGRESPILIIHLVGTDGSTSITKAKPSTRTPIHIPTSKVRTIAIRIPIPIITIRITIHIATIRIAIRIDVRIGIGISIRIHIRVGLRINKSIRVHCPVIIWAVVHESIESTVVAVTMTVAIITMAVMFLVRFV
jgi:hypothetical protein